LQEDTCTFYFRHPDKNVKKHKNPTKTFWNYCLNIEKNRKECKQVTYLKKMFNLAAEVEWIEGCTPE